MDFKLLQLVYRSVESYSPKRLYSTKNFGTYANNEPRIGVNFVCAVLTIPDKERRILEWSPTLTTIAAENDNFKGTPEERWEYMSKWLLDKIQSHPDYLKSVKMVE